MPKPDRVSTANVGYCWDGKLYKLLLLINLYANQVTVSTGRKLRDQWKNKRRGKGHEVACAKVWLRSPDPQASPPKTRWLMLSPPTPTLINSPTITKEVALQQTIKNSEVTSVSAWTLWKGYLTQLYRRKHIVQPPNLRHECLDY